MQKFEFFFKYKLQSRISNSTSGHRMNRQSKAQLCEETPSTTSRRPPKFLTTKAMSRNRSNKMIKQPIQVIFSSLQSKARVSVALYESDSIIEGIIVGFDEYMNLVLDDTTSHESSGDVTSLGRILLKGENITWIANAA